MKNIIAAAFLAIASIAAMAQAVDQASIAQKQRQLSSAGAVEGKKAYASGGLYALAKSSSDCMESVKSGATSAYKCMGIEALGLALAEKTPANNKTELAKKWFDSKTMTNRVYAYCFMFLGARSDIACAQTFATSKMATEGVAAGIQPFNEDGVVDASPATKNQAEKRADAQGFTPSFDCAKASTQVERLICSNEELARLDNDLFEIYNLAKDEHPRSHDGDTGKSSFPLGADQARWRTKVRDACKDVACLKTAYERRAVEIKTKFPY